ncbi:MAG TPA: response regulator transcription factor [Candidatus Onthocola gallistercoris]|uniref:Response regulator transcription factor n=1 Tax=Candidatus Onthocola gallistercoris TaxID=2840876 RepID=A0A9D1HFS9_9FIRM|nr:response regulator transcription factor [Candidatus Onthocola gallistercoris]
MIYCVEDDENIRELVIYTLKTTGFKAKGFGDGEAFMGAMKQEKPELVLMDIMLPGESGMDLLKKLKDDRKWKNIPVIMLTAKSSEYDKVLGLDGGADDYITKPFGMMELISRIKAVLRRTSQKTDSDVLEAGNIRMDVDRHEVWVDEELVTLTYKEFELLKLLLMNKNIVLSRDRLLEEIWGYDYTGETRTVDVHVRTLRQKLGEGGSYVETVRGIGYRIGDGHEA